MKKHFEPITAARNTSGGYQLLILDGHNSHCTYPFVSYAEQHKIIILCLPPHTTHALQPCDVSVFGPLQSAWGATVNEASRHNIVITKQNFLRYYSLARERALKSTTISASFEKTGIWPLNSSAIPTSAFKPSLTTSTEAASAVPLDLPSILEAIPEDLAGDQEHLSHASTPSSLPLSTTSAWSALSTLSAQSTSSTSSQYRISGLPSPLKHTASRDAFRKQNDSLFKIIVAVQHELEQKHAQIILLQSEVGALRRAQEAQRPRRKVYSTEPSGKACVLTDEESQTLLAREEFRKVIEGTEASSIFKSIKDRIQKEVQEAEDERKQREKGQREVERAAEKARRDAEKAAEKARKDAERAVEKERK